MIPVKKEPKGIDGIERCCFCRSGTKYWYIEKDVAVCPNCASIANPEDVPSKEVWCRRERIAEGLNND